MQTSLNIHSLTYSHLCFTDDSLVDVYLLYSGSGDSRHRIQRTSHVHLSPKPLPPVRDNQQGVLQWTQELPQTCLPILVTSTRVSQHPSIPTTTPASQPTCRTSAWRGGGIARTYAATVRTHVETLHCQLLCYICQSIANQLKYTFVNSLPFVFYGQQSCRTSPT